MVRFFATAVLCTFLLMSVLVTACTTKTDTTGHKLLNHCKTEDSVMCVWDGQTDGNGHGRSYWTDQHGTVHYL